MVSGVGPCGAYETMGYEWPTMIAHIIVRRLSTACGRRYVIGMQGLLILQSPEFYFINRDIINDINYWIRVIRNSRTFNVAMFWLNLKLIWINVNNFQVWLRYYSFSIFTQSKSILLKMCLWRISHCAVELMWIKLRIRHIYQVNQFQVR